MNARRVFRLLLVAHFGKSASAQIQDYEQKEHCNNYKTVGHELRHGNSRFINVVKSVGRVVEAVLRSATCRCEHRLRM
jgi:hypothetical protein